MIETRTKDIGGHTYALTLLGARAGQRVLLRLGKVLGPALANVATKGAEGLPDAVSAALDGATEADLDYLIDTFAASCGVQVPTTTKAGPGVVTMPLKPQYDSHFGNRYMDALAWLTWCVRENFGDFFDVKALSAAFDLPLAEPKSESPKD